MDGQVSSDLGELSSNIAQQQAQHFFSRNKFDVTGNAWVKGCLAAQVDPSSSSDKFVTVQSVKAQGQHKAAAMLVLVHELQPCAAGDASLLLKVRVARRDVLSDVQLCTVSVMTRHVSLP